jgi:hypothetical protein
LRANIGLLAGSGDLLVYGDWSETSGTSNLPPFPYPITSDEVHRIDGDACPCPTIASSPGPLYPADVNEDRVIAYGTNETVLLDRNGNRLLSLPVSPLAAQLAGTDLVLLVPGELRDYDTRSGALLHTWPMPAVPSGPECALRYCDSTDLVLSDAARGLVTYTLNDQIHVLRLADGTDRTVATGFDPRFMNDGLVYADNARIHLVRYDNLPLLAF